jgi:phosphotransacetylase
MPLPGFDQLEREADARRSPVPIAAAGGADRTVLEALDRAARRGWVRPIVVGRGDEIEESAQEAGIDLTAFRLIDSDEPAAAAVGECREGRAALLMKGRIATPNLLKAVLDPERGLRTGRAIGQFVLMEIPRDGKRFLMADTGIAIRPGLRAMKDFLTHAVELARALGEPSPRVALMAATESINPAMPETFQAAELVRAADAGAFPGCHVQGPLSFDLAYAADAGDKKRVGGPVVGAADVMLFPDLLSANLTVKAVMYTADCRFGGVLRGTSHPVVFMSRADATETRLRSMALALKLIPDE